MKKTVSKITAALLALLMFISVMSVGVFAANTEIVDATTKGTITVNGIEDSATATAYKLIDVHFDYTAMSPSDPEYTWVDNAALRAYLNEQYAGLVNDDGSVNETVLNTIKNSPSESEKFYDGLSAKIKDGTIALAEASHITGNGTISDLEMGNYLVVIEGGEKVYRASAVNVVPVYNEAISKWEIENPTITVKASDTKLTKKIILADGTEAEKVNASVNDAVNFALDADVPTYPAASANTKITVSDKLSDAFTLDSDSIKVYGVKDGMETLLAKDTAYTVSAQRPDGSAVSFAINFVYSEIKDYTSVRVKYTASLNEKAVIGGAGNVNTAYLDYNNNPYSSTETWKEYDATATVYSYGFDLKKVDSKTGDVLTGAEFTLYSDAAGTQAITFVKTADGKYTVSNGAGATDNLVATDGTLVLSGLKAGTYYLKETKAPEKYNLPKKLKALTIVDKDGVAANTDDVTFANGLVTYSIENSQGFTLPTTGGMGTILFTAGGIVLIAAGAAMAVVLNKKSKKSHAED